MKKIIGILILISFVLSGNAQTNSIITYSYSTRTLSPQTQVIPFDRPFTLLVTKFPNTKVKSIYVYDVHYQDGKMVLNRQINTSNLSVDSLSLATAATKPISLKNKNEFLEYLKLNKDSFNTHSFQIIEQCEVPVHKLKELIEEDGRNYTSKSDFQATFSISNDSLSIYYPAIRPSKYFDIEVFTGLDNANLQLVMGLNKAVMYNDSVKWYSLYHQLVIGTTEVNYSTSVNPANMNIGFYYLYLPIFNTLRFDSVYATIVNTPRSVNALPDTNALFNTEKDLRLQKIKYPDIYSAVKINLDHSWQQIVYGLLPANYTVSTAAADSFDFPTRIINLDISRLYFDSLSLTMDKLLAKAGSNPDRLSTISQINAVSIEITAREKAVKAGYNFIQDKINGDLRFRQSYMFGGNNQPVDLKTKSTFCMTTDLGFTNIFARDYTNKINYIPKLFFGINIYFRQFDKNADLSGLKYRICEHGLQSSRNPWQNLSLSLGLTLGSMSNPNFSNLYNSFSLTAGPSYRFAKILRLTAGAAFLQRTQANPELTTKQFIVGAFVAFSVDVDFLTPIKNITDLVFK